jgi:hypothetical protein
MFGELALVVRRRQPLAAGREPSLRDWLATKAPLHLGGERASYLVAVLAEP